jgi:biopolymer transport protein ExbD
VSESHDVKDTNVMGDINVTPLVDVMLVLLIIFMIVTPALLAGFKAQMPEGVHMKARKDDPERTQFGLGADGSYYLNKQPIARQNALALLEAEFKKHPDDKVLFLKADRNVPMSEVNEVFTLAKKAGAFVIAAVTECKPGREKQCSNVIVDDKKTTSQLQ